LGIGDWGLGIGDWGLGIGDWAQSPRNEPIKKVLLVKNKIKLNKKSIGLYQVFN